MKKITLTETELVNLIKKVISESATVNLNGRTLQIPGDGTILVQDVKGKMIKVKMSSNLGDINVAKIDKTNDGYSVTGRSGMSKNIDNETVNKIISFVDNVEPKTST